MKLTLSAASHPPNSSRHHSVHVRADIQGCVACASIPYLLYESHRPLATEILRAAKILEQMKKAHASNRGAAGLELEGGGKEMIDAPMIKQVRLVFFYPTHVQKLITQFTGRERSANCARSRAPYPRRVMIPTGGSFIGTQCYNVYYTAH